jgi:hypothetical protein
MRALNHLVFLLVLFSGIASLGCAAGGQKFNLPWTARKPVETAEAYAARVADSPEYDFESISQRIAEQPTPPPSSRPMTRTSSTGGHSSGCRH